ncbi:MAG TPA: hypothetical protein VHP58_06435 [Alphaproteobacteria bacterium]|nr:hypothetical protein [Alphaproteobacteria bacterium]
MADLFGSVLAPPLTPAAAADTAQVLRLNIDAAAAKVLQPFAGQGAVTLTVTQLLPGDMAVMALPNGQQITAQAPRGQLAVGAQLQLQVPSENTLANASANTAVIMLARMSPQVRTAAPVVNLPTPQANNQLAAPVLPTLQNLENVLRQTPLLNLPEDMLGNLAAAKLPATLPGGPVVLTPQTAVQAALPGGPAVLQVNTLPALPGQPQAATLYPIPAANQPPPAPVQVFINAGVQLPVGTELSFTVPQPANAQSNAPIVVQIPAPVPLPAAPVVSAQTSSQLTTLSAATGATVTAVTPAPVPTPASITLSLPAGTVPVTAPLTARVLTPATPLPAPQPGQPQLFAQQALLPNGQSLTLTTPAPLSPGTTLAVAPNPAAPAQPVVQGLTLSQAPVSTPAAPPAPQAATVPLPPGLPVGQTLAATVVQVPPQSAGAAPTLQLSIANPAMGETVPLTVNTPATLPQGTVLHITVSPTGQLVVEGITPPANLAAQQTLGLFENQWPQLAKAATDIAQTSPRVAQQLAAHLPQAGALMPGLASYVDALQHNNVQKWLGNEVVTMLRAMGVDLAPDLTQLSILRQPGPEAWQGVLFPYLETPQSQPQQGRFFWKNTPPEEEQQTSGNTRFLVEMNLSQLGEVQLDGLITYPELWLKLRVHPPADTSFGTGLQSTVQTMLESFGLSGGISIESTDTFPIEAARLVPAPTTPTLTTTL